MYNGEEFVVYDRYKDTYYWDSIFMYLIHNNILKEFTPSRFIKIHNSIDKINVEKWLIINNRGVEVVNLNIGNTLSDPNDFKSLNKIRNKTFNKLNCIPFYRKEVFLNNENFNKFINKHIIKEEV